MISEMHIDAHAVHAFDLWTRLADFRMSSDNTDMTQADQRAIQELAAALNKQAESITFIHFGVWTIGGTFLGMLLGGDTRSIQLLGAGTYALICGIIGWSVGQSRAASLRLQALVAIESSRQ
jgi:hypothetical protein